MGREKKKALSIDKIYKYDISKSNTFVISAAFDYSLIEQKIVNYIITKIQPDAVENATNKDNSPEREPLTYDIDFDELCKMSGMLICGRNYDYIKAAIESLRDKRINVRLPKNDGITGISFIDRYVYYENKGYASVRLDSRMIPLIIKMKDNFLKYNPRYTMLAKSKYTIRIYEWLKASMDKRQSGIKKQAGITKDINFTQMDRNEKREYVNKYTKVRNLDYEIRIRMQIFRENLGIGTNIKGYKMLYNKILSKCMDEINEQSDIMIKSIEYISDVDELVFTTSYKNHIELQVLNQIIEEKINNVYLPKTETSK